MKRVLEIFSRLLLGCFAIAAIPTAQSAPPTLDQQFAKTVKPFVNEYCVGCHSGTQAAAQLNLSGYSTVQAVTEDYPRWELLAKRLNAGEMPPKGAPQPPAATRRQVVEWIQTVRMVEGKKHAGDPGIVPARRLSNAEYNNTIRDLTGRDLQPAREFPVDPANPAGFDNSGESLTMSSALLNKYLQAAHEVADHMVLAPEGFQFSPWPALVETDREKYAVQQIIQFYFQQPTDYADYFQAAWRFRNRKELGKPGATLASLAAEAKISAKYLSIVWETLHEKDAAGPIAKLQHMWQDLPSPASAGADHGEALRAGCMDMRDFVVRIRKHTAMQFAAPKVRGLPGASQPLLNWKLKQFASHRRDSDPNDLRNDTDPPPVVPEIPRRPGLHQEAAPRWAALSAKARAGDADLIVPAAERKRYEAAFSRFASVFPDTFYITERGRYFPDDSEDKGRLLSAGYHSVIGFYRDDAPLMELILDEKGRQQLNRLWDDFEYIAAATARTWEQFYFNQSGEVDGKGAESSSPRPIGHLITDEPVILGMKEKYLAKAAADPNNDPVAAEAIRDHFDRINRTLRDLERERAASEPKHIEALLRFAARAYRRPLTKIEAGDLQAYYRRLREKSSLSHEDALRNTLTSVLVSPEFLYRVDLGESAATRRPAARTNTAKAAGASAVEPLSPYSLASRLSYVLWASMPDEELLQHAEAGDLKRPEVLLAQTCRMLKSEKVSGLATEFGGNWLDFRRFETNNTVDRQRFPTFMNPLREAMFQEPVRLLTDVILNGRSVLDMLYGDYTFVNPVLAQHYGMPAVKGSADTWARVDGAGKYGRGGLLPMAVFLTQNSPGLRTSPVKRGYWVVRRVLGEVIPPPPPVVPELPQDEGKTDLPLRDLLAQHRANPVCASCHARFDVFGLAMEGYGPVGEARTVDLGGRPVDAAAVFPGGERGSGLEGLRTYIRAHRQEDFVDNLCRKLLAYSLNRSLQFSDETMVAEMKMRLKASEYRFAALVETIVASPAFLNRRVPGPYPAMSSNLRRSK